MSRKLLALSTMFHTIPGVDLETYGFSHSTNYKEWYDRVNTKRPMNHAAAKRAKIKRRNKRLHPRGCK